NLRCLGALILFREPDSAANQVSNSQFQLGRRKRLFEKIDEIAGESLEVGSVVAFPICSRICRYKKNGQLWIIPVQHERHLSARKIGQFDVAHKEGKPATPSGGFDGLQPSARKAVADHEATHMIATAEASATR